LGEGHRQTVFEGRVLRKTFWAEEVPADCGLEEAA